MYLEKRIFPPKFNMSCNYLTIFQVGNILGWRLSMLVIMKGVNFPSWKLFGGEGRFSRLRNVCGKCCSESRPIWTCYYWHLTHWDLLSRRRWDPTHLDLIPLILDLYGLLHVICYHRYPTFLDLLPHIPELLLPDATL